MQQPTFDLGRDSPLISDVELNPPNLRPLRLIFPKTDDWWRRVLYAHLLAYNYVLSPLTPTLESCSFPALVSTTTLDSRPGTAVSVSSRQMSLPNRFNTSAKASKTLGMVLPTTPYLSARESKLEEAKRRLEDAMEKVVDCMVGEDTGKAEPGFVRALAEVVRACEGLA
jgi:hypothetical protein